MKRVNISYSVELDEIPNLLEELMDKASEDAHMVIESMSLINFGMNLIELNKKIDSIRKTLSKIDNRLDDCLLIATGYHQVKLQEYSDSSETDNKYDSDSLSEKLSSFKELLKETEAYEHESSE